jgi:hypothetical protein
MKENILYNHSKVEAWLGQEDIQIDVYKQKISSNRVGNLHADFAFGEEIEEGVTEVKRYD